MGSALTLLNRVPCMQKLAFQSLKCVTLAGGLIVFHFGQEIHCRKITPSQASEVKPINDFQSLALALQGSAFMNYSDPQLLPVTQGILSPSVSLRPRTQRQSRMVSQPQNHYHDTDGHLRQQSKTCLPGELAVVSGAWCMKSQAGRARR